jgi:Holliday junction resolvase RusA-like endonuclease
VIKIRVYGEPVPQGSKVGFVVRKGGRPTSRAVVVDDNKATLAPWRQSITNAAREAAKDGQWDGAMLVGALEVSLVFFMPRPKNHYGTGANAGQLRPSAPAAPVTKPDQDKLARAALDGLTAAGLWQDDSQVCICQVLKTYGARLVGADEAPGVMIEVGEIGG